MLTWHSAASYVGTQKNHVTPVYYGNLSWSVTLTTGPYLRKSVSSVTLSYGHHLNLLNPYKETNGELSAQQVLYDNCPSSTRKAIWRSFGLLKGRLRILNDLNCHLQNLNTIVVACCVQHNVCLSRNDWFPFAQHASSAIDMGTVRSGEFPVHDCAAKGPAIMMYLSTLIWFDFV